MIDSAGKIRNFYCNSDQHFVCAIGLFVGFHLAWTLQNLHSLDAIESRSAECKPQGCVVLRLQSSTRALEWSILKPEGVCRWCSFGPAARMTTPPFPKQLASVTWQPSTCITANIMRFLALRLLSSFPIVALRSVRIAGSTSRSQSTFRISQK